jgi:serine/threonine protein kinase
MQAGNKNVTSPIEERIRDQNLTLDDIKISRTLGKGQFGRVLLATSLKTRQHYALKVLMKRNFIKTGQVCEIRRLAQINQSCVKQLKKRFAFKTGQVCVKRKLVQIN